jgi:hypothetical protein
MSMYLTTTSNIYETYFIVPKENLFEFIFQYNSVVNTEKRNRKS